MATDRDSYVARHSTVGSGAAGRATDGEDDSTLIAEARNWTTPSETTAETSPDMSEMPDPDGSHHDI